MGGLLEPGLGQLLLLDNLVQAGNVGLMPDGGPRKHDLMPSW